MNTATTTAKIEKLATIGNRWTKENVDRIYFDLIDAGIINAKSYGSGNVNSATWADGDKLSNGDANKMLSAKYFLNTNDLVVRTQGHTDGNVEYAAKMLQALVDAA